MKTLLIIDDNELVVNSFVRHYSKIGFFCLGLTNSEEVLQLLLKEPFAARKQEGITSRSTKYFFPGLRSG